MATKTEGSHQGEFIVSEARGTQSREVVTLISGQNCVAGTVLSQITASGKWQILAPAGSLGAELARGILLDNTDATAGDTLCVAIVRLAEVNDKELVYPGGITGPQKITAQANLRSLSLIETR